MEIQAGRSRVPVPRFRSELWAKMVSLYGQQHTIQLMMITGDYFRVGFMLNTVDPSSKTR
jgi:hypothetical protein